eukprot:1337746-Rhodomonas_salina.2
MTGKLDRGSGSDALTNCLSLRCPLLTSTCNAHSNRTKTGTWCTSSNSSNVNESGSSGARTCAATLS